MSRQKISSDLHAIKRGQSKSIGKCVYFLPLKGCDGVPGAA